jgi:hypothetical protein
VFVCIQVIDLTRQQELTKQQDAKAKEAEYRAQAAAQAKVRDLKHTGHINTPGQPGCLLLLYQFSEKAGSCPRDILRGRAFAMCAWHITSLRAPALSKDDRLKSLRTTPAIQNAPMAPGCSAQSPMWTDT